MDLFTLMGEFERLRTGSSPTARRCLRVSAAMFDAVRAIGTLASSGNARFARVASREKN